MKRKTAKLLLDAESACQEIQDFSIGVTKQAFLESRMLNLAFTRLTEIIGEALKQAADIDPALVQQITNPRKIIGTRNRIIHRYDDVDYSLLWDIATKEVPLLQRELQELLESAPGLRGEQQPDEA